MPEQELKRNCDMTQDEIQDVLASIRIIAAEKLFSEYIKPGCITIQEMMNTGNLDAEKRLKILSLEEVEKKKEESAWDDTCNKKDLTAYINYLNIYPNGRYVNLAKVAIEEIKKIEEDKKKEKEVLLNNIQEVPNNYTPHEINTLIKDGVFSEVDLINRGIGEDIVTAVKNLKEPKLRLGDVPSEITAGFTEVYFWGMPSSGKTCALSGILSHADSTGILQTQSGDGFHYMNQLKNIFSRQLGFLPQATNVEKTQYLPFHLKDVSGQSHPIALIELSGEIFKCFYRIQAGLALENDAHIETTNTVKRYLKGQNRKVHFFVIDLDRDPKDIDEDFVKQEDYLDAAQKYFTSNRIFERLTDAIYIIATKSDTLKCSKHEQEEKASEHLTSNYPSFINTLKDVCRRNRINERSNLKFIPFSLGDVYFKKICKFNPSSSAEIIKILQQKTGRLQNKKWWNKLND